MHTDMAKGVVNGAHLYLRGRISLPRILPGNKRKPIASCMGRHFGSAHDGHIRVAGQLVSRYASKREGIS